VDVLPSINFVSPLQSLPSGSRIGSICICICMCPHTMPLTTQLLEVMLPAFRLIYMYDAHGPFQFSCSLNRISIISLALLCHVFIPCFAAADKNSIMAFFVC